MKNIQHPHYDVAIATRNRPEALALSIPLILNQDPLPQQIVVVDSSDDHQTVKELVESILGPHEVPFEIIHSEPGLTLQRNICIAKAKAEIVFLPDDDSLFFPDTAQQILTVYALDHDKTIGGVCSAESPESPLDQNDSSTYQMTLADRIKNQLSHLRCKLEQRFFKDPFIIHGRSVYPAQQPDWFREHDVVPVEYMTGFRMTFRTAVVQSLVFDERLRKYGLFEDVDASFFVSSKKSLVGARQAKIYHHKFPSARANGYYLGYFQVFNRNYILAKHTETNSEARKRASIYAFYKMAQYALLCLKAQGRGRLIGAWDAHRDSKRLFNATSPEEVGALYTEISESKYDS